MPGPHKIGHSEGSVDNPEYLPAQVPRLSLIHGQNLNRNRIFESDGTCDLNDVTVRLRNPIVRPCVSQHSDVEIQRAYETGCGCVRLARARVRARVSR